jgi:tetratricopeptide (TPR) repeat protein
MNEVVFTKASERNALGLAYLEEGSITKATSQFTKACLLAPAEPSYFLHKAESSIDAGDISTAISIYRIAIQKINQAQSQSQSRENITQPRRLYLETRLASIHYLYGQVLLDQVTYVS